MHNTISGHNLKEHKKLFDGNICAYPDQKVHIDIEPNAKNVHVQSYPMPCMHLSTFKHELDYLLHLGILVPQLESKCESPSFIIPKKYSSFHCISNLCQLNKVIKHNQYSVLVITNILCTCIENKFFTKLQQHAILCL